MDRQSFFDPESVPACIANEGPLAGVGADVLIYAIPEESLLLLTTPLNVKVGGGRLHSQGSETALISVCIKAEVRLYDMFPNSVVWARTQS